MQHLQIGDASFAEALTGEQTDFDLGLIEPASVRGCVMEREAIPDPVSRRLAVIVGQRFPAMDVEVVDDEMNRAGIRIIPDQMTGAGANSAAERSGVAKVKCFPD